MRLGVAEVPAIQHGELYGAYVVGLRHHSIHGAMPPASIIMRVAHGEAAKCDASELLLLLAENECEMLFVDSRCCLHTLNASAHDDQASIGKAQ